MTERQCARLQAATDVLMMLCGSNLPPAGVMAKLVAEHGARLKTMAWTNSFRFGGLTVTCTWSADEGLIENWRKTATLLLTAARHGGAGDER